MSGRTNLPSGSHIAGGDEIPTVEPPFSPGLREALDLATKAADNTKTWLPKNKHILGGGSQSKARFNTANFDKIRALVSEALRSPDARLSPNPKIPGSFRSVTDLGRSIGVKGQQSVRVIVSNDGNVLNAFPVHVK